MEKEFIPYEQALALKELGFNEPCLAFYNKENKITIMGISKVRYSPKLLTPTFSQSFRWFREKYGKLGCIKKANDRNRFIYLVNDIVFAFYDSYEEAEIECLKKLIEIVKEK